MKGLLRLLPAAALISMMGTDAAIAAGESGWAHIEKTAIASNMGNVVYIRVDHTPTTPATCSTHATWHFTLPLDTDWGKSMYAMLLEARATGRQLWFSGTNTCAQDGTVESLRSLTVAD